MGNPRCSIYVPIGNTGNITHLSGICSCNGANRLAPAFRPERQRCAGERFNGIYVCDYAVPDVPPMARGSRRKLQRPAVRRCPKNTIIAAPDPDPGWQRRVGPEPALSEAEGATGSVGRLWSPDLRFAASGVAPRGIYGIGYRSGSGLQTHRQRYNSRLKPSPAKPDFRRNLRPLLRAGGDVREPRGQRVAVSGQPGENRLSHRFLIHAAGQISVLCG